MTIDEAIRHCEEVADKMNDCECAADHRQLAEWLTELKELREIFSKVDTGAIKPKDYLDLLDEWAKARKLLKVMYEDIKRYAGGMCRVCTECNADFECKCEDFCTTNKRSKWKYKYEPEILALIGEDGDAEWLSI